MEYYIIKNSPSEKDIWIIDTDYPEGIFDLINEGKSFIEKLEGKSVSMEYKRKNGRKTDWVNGIQSIDIISEKFKLLIEEEHVDQPFLEFYPAFLNYKGNNLKEKYYCFNTLTLVNAFDREKSIYSVYEDTDIVKSIDKLVLDTSKINNRNIFRVEQVETILFVSKLLKEKIEKANLSGLEFMKIEDYMVF